MLGKMLDAKKNVGAQRTYLGNKSVQWGKIDTQDLSLIKLTPNDLRRYRLTEGDLLVCEGGEIGRSAIWLGQVEECYFQKALHRLRSRRGYSPVLLRYLLEYYSKAGFLLNFAIQTSIAHLPKDKFEVLPLPRPPVQEQEVIAKALSDADAMIEGLERLIAKKRLIKQGAMQDLLTARRRLPGFSRRWLRFKLGEFLKFKNGLNKAKAYFGYGTPIVNYMDVFGGGTINDRSIAGLVEVTSAEQSAYGVNDGDVLFTRTSETSEEIGLAAVADGVPSRIVFSGFVLRGRPQNQMITVPYSKYCFRSDPVRRQIISRASYTTRALTNGRQLSLVEMFVPEEADEQNAIAKVLHDMDAEIQTLQIRREKTRRVREGMMQNLLTGRIRLV